MKEDKKIEERADRMESYPQPSPSDKRYDNQPEYQDQQPNSFEDKSVSNVPNTPARDQTNEPPGGERA